MAVTAGVTVWLMRHVGLGGAWHSAGWLRDLASVPLQVVWDLNGRFLAAGAVLFATLLPLAAVAVRASPIDGLVALEVAGVLGTLALVCLAVGLQSTATTGSR